MEHVLEPTQNNLYFTSLRTKSQTAGASDFLALWLTKLLWMKS